MLSQFILLGLAISGVLGNLKTECFDEINENELEERLMNDPNANELNTVCPQVFTLMDCMNNYVENKLGLTIEEAVNTSTDPDVVKEAKLMINVKDTFKDLCNRSSELYGRYRVYMYCLRYIPEYESICERRANKALKTYKNFESNVDEEDANNTRTVNEECLKTAYMVACLGYELRYFCGGGAFLTFRKILKRTTLLRNSVCSEEDLQILKTSFLESLDLEERKQIVFQVVFEANAENWV